MDVRSAILMAHFSLSEFVTSLKTLILVKKND